MKKLLVILLVLPCGYIQEMMALTDDFADGYYFSFPFNRVGMLAKILSFKEI